MKPFNKYALLAFPLLFWLAICFGLGFDGRYGQDAYEYQRFATALKNSMLTGQNPGDYFWGIYYPAVAALVDSVFNNMAVSLQFVSAVSLIITTAYLQKLIRLIYRKIDEIPFLFFTLSPFVLVHSVLAMSDLLACCFCVIAAYYFLKFAGRLTARFFLLGVVAAAFAFFTRYASAVILVPFAIYALVKLLRERRWLLLCVSLIAAMIIAVPHFLLRPHHPAEFLSHQWLLNWNPQNLIRNDFETIDGRMHYSTINLIYVLFSIFHPAFLFAGFFALPLFFSKVKKLSVNQKMLLVAIGLYALFLAGIPFQNKRFLILSFPFIIALLYPALSRMLGEGTQKKITFAIVATIQLLLTAYYLKPFVERNRLEQRICAEMYQYESATLYAFDIDIAMKGRNMDFNYKSLWKDEQANFTPNALILVDARQIEKQWVGKNPEINWRRLNTNYRLATIKSIDNFTLYRIESKK
ncbi:MAG: hypothetical protein EOO51_04135 [Flavobacterium sp.]|nr:MAG: hypothetical protein EOO51_04135 [Flavobacterium sp.]